MVWHLSFFSFLSFLSRCINTCSTTSVCVSNLTESDSCKDQTSYISYLSSALLRASWLHFYLHLYLRLYLHLYRYRHAFVIFFNRFLARLCILPVFFYICFCVVYIIYIYFPFCLSFLPSFVGFVLCSRWSLADIPLMLSCPADHVPDWQPGTLLCIAEARSVNVKNANTHTHRKRCEDAQYTAK